MRLSWLVGMSWLAMSLVSSPILNTRPDALSLIMAAGEELHEGLAPKVWAPSRFVPLPPRSLLAGDVGHTSRTFHMHATELYFVER